MGWRAPAYSLIQAVQLGDKRKLGKCRPKRFLVASGAEYHSHQGKRDYVMRGTSVLPDEKGGRKAFMWLLAVGMPLEGEMVALVGPTLQQNEFEVRGIWLWKRAFRFPDDALMSETDLRRVNLDLVWQGFLFLGWCNLKKLVGSQVQKDSRRPMFVCLFGSSADTSGNVSASSNTHRHLILSKLRTQLNPLKPELGVRTREVSPRIGNWEYTKS